VCVFGYFKNETFPMQETSVQWPVWADKNRDKRNNHPQFCLVVYYFNNIIYD
jgi:hypothetical protein